MICCAYAYTAIMVYVVFWHYMNTLHVYRQFTLL